MRTRTALTLLSAAALLAALTACTPTTPAADDTDTDTDTGSTDTGDSTTDDDGFAGATVSGTGSYRIPDDIPYGGYQLVGDPGLLPAGCTWSITGDDGEQVADSTGAYVFITDIPEADTFTTAGCPDWEQFE